MRFPASGNWQGTPDAPGAESLTASISMFSQNGPAKANPQESLRPEL
jgi:hypothetical protein